MSPSDDRRSSCVGPLALTLGLAALAFLIVALPWRAKLNEYQQTATDYAAQLASFEARLAKRPDVERALAGLQARTGVQRSYIQGQTLGLAGANLQQLTKGLIEDAGGTLISSQIVTPQAEPPLQMLVNKVRMRGTTENLLKLAHRVESGEPALFLDNLLVRSARRQRRPVDELDIQFDLAGYMRLAEETQ
ncbi:MAG: type II secretion system protein M [Chromatiaceae bacterium]|nr:type II secretion system protein M [Chromatiaceae bacterium]